MNRQIQGVIAPHGIATQRVVDRQREIDEWPTLYRKTVPMGRGQHLPYRPEMNNGRIPLDGDNIIKDE